MRWLALLALLAACCSHDCPQPVSALQGLTWSECVQHCGARGVAVYQLHAEYMDCLPTGCACNRGPR